MINTLEVFTTTPNPSKVNVTYAQCMIETELRSRDSISTFASKAAFRQAISVMIVLRIKPSLTLYPLIVAIGKTTSWNINLSRAISITSEQRTTVRKRDGDHVLCDVMRGHDGFGERPRRSRIKVRGVERRGHWKSTSTREQHQVQ